LGPGFLKSRKAAGLATTGDSKEERMIMAASNNPQNQTNRVLDHLASLAGGRQALASLLGLQVTSIYNWAKDHQISLLGAVLIERSRLFGILFSARDIRPDLTREYKKYILTTAKFERHLSAQQRFESSGEWRRTPLYIALERFKGEKI
jgi:DNA-binding transcriptional regulator YdaS (Cro superfamily)